MKHRLKWRCERLDSNSISNPCADAKKRGLANCIGCDGAVKIDAPVNIAPKRPESRTCIIKGCGKWRVTGDYCTVHGREAEEAAKVISVPIPIPQRADDIRTFDTGATRSPLGDKLQYEGYLSPLVLQRFAQYMRKHQVQSDGNVRPADNWQKGIPLESLIDSGTRHYMDWWLHHRGYNGNACEPIEEALCALMFNVMAYLKHVMEVDRC